MAELVRLITGYMGAPHITADDDGYLNRGILGVTEKDTGGYYFEKSCLPELTVNNGIAKVRNAYYGEDDSILCVFQGREVEIKPQTLAITKGTSGMPARVDWVVLRYQKNASTHTESCSIVYVPGVETEHSAPHYEDKYIGNDPIVDLPLFSLEVSNVADVDNIKINEAYFNSTSGLGGKMDKVNPFFSGTIHTKYGTYDENATASNRAYFSFDGKATGKKSAAIGQASKATGDYSNAIGRGTSATESDQIALGKYNEETTNALEVFGMGTNASSRKNARVLTSAGTEELFGDVIADREGERVSLLGLNGHTNFIDGQIDSLKLSDTEINMLGWSVPSEFKINNAVSGNTFIQKVGRVDLGTLSWTYLSDWKCWYTYDYSDFLYGTVGNNDTTPTNIYMHGYKNVSINTIMYKDGSNSISQSLYSESRRGIFVENGSSTDKPTGYLYSELATPITKTIDGNEVVEQYANAGYHNSVYRGKYLGTSVTDTQWSAIQSGTFTDLYIGDYWTISGVNWRIASFDYWLNTGDTICTKHHAVIVPDTCLYNAKMNDTDITTGAYTGSTMYSSNLDQAKSTITSAFGGDHILSRRALLSTFVASGKATGWAWKDSTVDLMGENMLFGSSISSQVNVSSVNLNTGIEKTQLQLFVLDKTKINNMASYWLRDVVSATSFSAMFNAGYMNGAVASSNIGVRPVFAIK